MAFQHECSAFGTATEEFCSGTADLSKTFGGLGALLRGRRASVRVVQKNPEFLRLHRVASKGGTPTTSRDRRRRARAGLGGGRYHDLVKRAPGDALHLQGIPPRRTKPAAGGCGP